jgi:hypothetical protein
MHEVVHNVLVLYGLAHDVTIVEVSDDDSNVVAPWDVVETVGITHHHCDVVSAFEEPGN